MGTESEFSSGGSDHEDSDTIVISSKSRIIISPRKKGSKAVSKLLGSAADDVVEQILRGSDGGAEVVTKTKHSTVRAGSKQYVVREGEGEQQSSNSRHVAGTRTMGGAAKREAGPQRSMAAMTTTTERRVAKATELRTTHDRARHARSSERTAAADGSEYSDMSSRELSAPSSEEDEDDAEEEEYYEEEQGQHRQERTHQHTQRQQPAQQQRQPVHQQSSAHRAGVTRASMDEHHNGTGVHRMVEQEHDSDSVYAGAADELSDASSSTKGSSLSQREPEVRPRVQRKFDDQLQTTVQSTRQVSRTSRSAEQRMGSGSYEDHTVRVRQTAKPRVRRDQRARHVEATDLDDSVILPSSATQEMEDLKQTLKNLAHHDPLMNGPSNGANKTVLLLDPPKKSTSFSGNSKGGFDQAQYVKPFQNGYEEAAWSATTSALNRFEESTSKVSKKLSSGRHATRTATRHADSESDSDGSEPSVARRLFSTPPHRISAKNMSTPPTAPASFVSKRTPSPQSALFQTPKTHSTILDTSFTTATPSTAQGSRAVLSALKALQDKIRRLEEEREKLMQELSDIKVKARKREAEFASNEKKFTYELGQTKESARAAYDAIRSEREELKLELVKYEERRKAMEAELHHAHKLSSTFSAKADDLQAQLQSSETQRASQNAEMEAARGAHKQEMRDMKNELVALQKEKESAQEQIRQLQAQLERESQSHAETRERLHEAEQTVAGITQLNDKLVSKVWEANEIATKATKKSKKLQQSQRVSTLSRPTAASRAASISAANGAMTPGRPSSAATKKALAGSISAKNPASAKKEKRGSQSLGSNNLELLRAANLGRDIPFVLGTSANRSHSIISNVQEAIRQCDTTYATPVTNPPPTPTFLKTRKSSSKSRKASTSASEQLDAISRSGTSASVLGIDGTEQSTTLVGSRTKARASNGNMSDTAYSATSKRPSSIRVPTPSTSYPNPMKSQILEDLQTAVETAEAEFTTLNRKYKNAVSKVESGRDGAAQLAKGLGSMLDELEAKGKQLNLLKQVYEQASRSTINPVRHVVHSPEAVQRKAASLRILNGYRQMERDAKSPRNGAATPGSPTNTNATSRRGSFFSDGG